MLTNIIEVFEAISTISYLHIQEFIEDIYQSLAKWMHYEVPWISLGIGSVPQSANILTNRLVSPHYIKDRGPISFANAHTFSEEIVEPELRLRT
jgi:hypothetical protein